MARQNIPTQQNVKTLMYGDLMGVDYQSDSTEVSRRHSPEMVNMISDLGGNPVKRYGYRRIGNAYDGFALVNGDDWAVKRVAQETTPVTYRLHAVKVAVNSNGEFVESSDKELSTRTNFGSVKHIFGFQTYLYVMCENEWIEYDTESDTVRALGTSEGTMWDYDNDPTIIRVNMPDKKYIPTVATMYKPNGQELITLPDGTDITGATEGVNLLTPFRRVEYCVTTDTANERVFTIPNQAKMSANIIVEILDSATFEWKEITTYTVSDESAFACRRPDNVRNVGSFVIDAVVTLNTSPYIKVVESDTPFLRFRDAPTVTVPAGEPNVRITFAPFNLTEFSQSEQGTPIYNGYYSAYRNGIFASDAVELYDSRLFAGSGVRTYYSRASSLLKMDDNFYFDVDNDVMAYAKASNSIAIVSEDTGKNTIYLASGTYDPTLAMTVYSIKASNASIGAVSTRVIGKLNDEPMFLSKIGLYGITTNYLSEKFAIMRSGKINRVLCKEPNLETAVGTNFNGYFYIAVNGHMYVLDSRHKDASRNGDNSYECYYFDNMPNITSINVISNRMFFSDGIRTYTWNDDLEPQYQYLDDAVMDAQTYVWSGTPVKCKWCSPIDGDGAPQYYKTLQKKGTMVTLAPPMQTSCQITLIRDARDVVYVGRFNGSTFALSDAVLDAFTKKKVKKYKRLQFVIENNEPEPFGIISIVKSFVMNNYAKR